MKKWNAVFVAALFLAGCGEGSGLPAAPASSPTPVPTPTPYPVSGIVSVFAGDIADGGPGAAATARLIKRINPVLVAPLGDLAYHNGEKADFDTKYHPAWGDFIAISRPAQGNHDGYEPTVPNPYYFTYFGGNAGPADTGYYFYRAGSWLAFSLNSNLRGGAMETQLRNVASTLQTNRADCIVAYWHHPVITSGPNRDSPWMAPMWKLLYDNRVTLVLVAHDHFYERMVPMDGDLRIPASPSVHTMEQITVGTGGHSTLYQKVRSEPRSAFFKNDTHGVLVVVLGEGRYYREFVPVEGNGPPQDAATRSCRIP